MSKHLLFISSLSGALAVLLGAFGAHALSDSLAASQLAVYKTAVDYHFVHTLALLGVSILLHRQRDTRSLVWSGWAFAGGIFLFSGSLYLYALSGVRWLGMITPFGGVMFVGGWLLLAAYALSQGNGGEQ